MVNLLYMLLFILVIGSGAILIYLHFFLTKTFSQVTEFQNEVKLQKNKYQFCIILPSPHLDPSYAYLLAKNIDQKKEYQFLCDCSIHSLQSKLDEYCLEETYFDRENSRKYLMYLSNNKKER